MKRNRTRKGRWLDMPVSDKPSDEKDSAASKPPVFPPAKPKAESKPKPKASKPKAEPKPKADAPEHDDAGNYIGKRREA